MLRAPGDSPDNRVVIDSIAAALPAPSVQPQLGDVLRIRRELAALDPLHDVGEHRVGARRNADPLALARDQAVDELDLGAPALLHVLAHRGPLPRRGAPRVLEALGVAG